MLTVSNNEHEYPKQRRELPSTLITLLMASLAWHVPGGGRITPLLLLIRDIYLGTYIILINIMQQLSEFGIWIGTGQISVFALLKNWKTEAGHSQSFLPNL